MRVIIVENMKSQRNPLVDELLQLNCTSYVERFVDEEEAFKAILSIKPNLVFIDIGSDLHYRWNFLEQMRIKMPKTKTIILAEDEKFALDAFKLNVFDYILKPVKGLRINHTINKYLNVGNAEDVRNNQMMVCTFQALNFSKRNSLRMLDHTPWRTQKGKEIFCFLVHNRMNFVRRDTILRKLWPNIDRKRAMSQLYTTIYHIRKTIESMNLPIEIITMEDFYMLDLNGVLLDTDLFTQEYKLEQLVTSDTLPLYLEKINLYTGEYFEEEGYEWARTERYRLRMYWMSYIRSVATYYINQEEFTEAIILYMQMQNRYPAYEESYEELIKLFYQIGDRSSAHKQYRALTKVMEDLFDTKPNRDISEWYEEAIEAL